MKQRTGTRLPPGYRFYGDTNKRWSYEAWSIEVREQVLDAANEAIKAVRGY